MPVVNKKNQCAQVPKILCKKEIIHLEESDEEELAKEDEFIEFLRSKPNMKHRWMIMILKG